MFSSKLQTRGNGSSQDITPYVISYNWSGSVDQAARKLEFTIAYNTKDKGFKNISINDGDTVYLYYSDDNIPNAAPCEIFKGSIVSVNRNTSNFTMEFVAFDKLLLLAKNKATRKFSNITVENVIRQVCNDFGVEIGHICDIGVYVNFIADNQSGTEMINKALYYAYVQNKLLYHMYMKENKLYVIQRNEEIESYIATDDVNIEHTQHSVSIENMVNTVVIVNKAGEEIGRVSNDSDLAAYGKRQAVYKENKKKNTQLAAQAMLKTAEFKSSLSGLGNIQCISGYSIIIHEEQLKGRFNIKSDKHSISNNVHKMELELVYFGTPENIDTTETDDTNNTGGD